MSTEVEEQSKSHMGITTTVNTPAHLDHFLFHASSPTLANLVIFKQISENSSFPLQFLHHVVRALLKVRHFFFFKQKYFTIITPKNNSFTSLFPYCSGFSDYAIFFFKQLVHSHKDLNIIHTLPPARSVSVQKLPPTAPPPFLFSLHFSYSRNHVCPVEFPTFWKHPVVLTGTVKWQYVPAVRPTLSVVNPLDLYSFSFLVAFCICDTIYLLIYLSGHRRYRQFQILLAFTLETCHIHLCLS